MQKKTIKITVTATGSITAEATGPGPSCTDQLEAIQRLLPDAVVTDSRLTPAYHQTLNQDVDTQQLQHETDSER